MVEVAVPAQEGVKIQEPVAKERSVDISLSTIPSLVTSILDELRRTYVMGEAPKEVKLRAKIDKVIEIINGDSRLAGMVVKDKRKILQKLWSRDTPSRKSDQVEKVGKTLHVEPKIDILGDFSDMHDSS